MPLPTNSIPRAQTSAHISIIVVLATLGAEVENLTLHGFFVANALSKQESSARPCDSPGHCVKLWHKLCLLPVINPLTKHLQRDQKRSRKTNEPEAGCTSFRCTGFSHRASHLTAEKDKKVTDNRVIMFYTNYVKTLHGLTEYSNVILGGDTERL